MSTLPKEVVEHFAELAYEGLEDDTYDNDNGELVNVFIVCRRDWDTWPCLDGMHTLDVWTDAEGNACAKAFKGRWDALPEAR